ncbi:MAG TPA: NADH-quinone oxidoreductase subunit NuoK [Tepidisphaeraceae bacterium]|jgi:NADH-quinone oxidoreductase subunit K|nr:NADH-quinone oxidoreductase subunit NuoK [Tepidisphaeraceae bacterium]
MPITLHHYLVLSALLFTTGLLTILLKRNALAILMGIELLLNSVTLNLVAFNHFSPTPTEDGQIFALFIILIAAAEAAIALAIILNFYNNFSSIDPDRAQTLKG